MILTWFWRHQCLLLPRSIRIKSQRAQALVSNLYLNFLFLINCIANLSQHACCFYSIFSSGLCTCHFISQFLISTAHFPSSFGKAAPSFAVFFCPYLCVRVRIEEVFFVIVDVVFTHIVCSFSLALSFPSRLLVLSLPNYLHESGKPRSFEGGSSSHRADLPALR